MQLKLFKNGKIDIEFDKANFIYIQIYTFIIQINV